MHKAKRNLCLCFLAAGLASLSSCSSSASATNPPQSPLDSILTQIQTGLQLSQDRLNDSGLPPLQQVQLTLHTEAQKDATGKVSLFVVTVGGGPAVTNYQELVLTLVPPTAGQRVPSGATDIANSIVALVAEAARAVKAAQDGKPPLKADTLTLEFGFTLTVSGNAGLKLTFAPVSAELGGSMKNSDVQKAKLTFAVTKASSQPK